MVNFSRVSKEQSDKGIVLASLIIESLRGKMGFCRPSWSLTFFLVEHRTELNRTI